MASVDAPLHGDEPNEARPSVVISMIAGRTRSIASRSHRSISTIRHRPVTRRATGGNCDRRRERLAGGTNVSRPAFHDAAGRHCLRASADIPDRHVGVRGWVAAGIRSAGRRSTEAVRCRARSVRVRCARWFPASGARGRGACGAHLRRVAAVLTTHVLHADPGRVDHHCVATSRSSRRPVVGSDANRPGRRRPAVETDDARRGAGRLLKRPYCVPVGHGHGQHQVPVAASRRGR